MTIHDPQNPVYVSVAASATGTACARANAAELLAMIRAGEWQAKVEQVRGALATSGRDAANAIKRTLPGILWSGEFTTRRKSALVRHSGLLCVDADHVENPASLRDQLAGDPHCLAAFVSPSGDGVKALFAVDPARSHADSWHAVNQNCRSAFGLEIDPACKDVSRLCFASYDPAAFIAAGPVACISYPAAVPTAPVAAPPPHHGPLTPEADFNLRGDVLAVLCRHGWTTSDDENLTRPGKSSGTSATFGMIPDAPRLFHVFTSNAPPFEADKAYEPFQVFSLLECNGDDAEALAALKAQGFGAADFADNNGAFLILPSAYGPSISASADQIFATIATTRTLFMRGRVPHEVLLDAHGARLEPMKASRFRSFMEKFGQLMVRRADREGRRKLVTAICPEETASALLATTEARERLPRIGSIITSPTLALQGDELITLSRGYNPQNSGVFVTGDTVPIVVPLSEAVAALSSLLDDFDFQSPGDRSRALASLVTPALKAGGLLTAPTPVEVTEADKSQAGKGYRQKLVAAVYAETPSFVTQREGGVGSIDETISSALIVGRPFIQLDNFRGRVASAHLEAILTAEGPVPCRDPHKPVVEVDVRPFTFSMTSNGVETTRDLANRCSIVRIKKRPPAYQFRTYPEGGLLEHVKARQTYYLSCVFAVVGEWFVEGSQRTNENRHDFRVWAQSLDWIARNVFHAAPLMDGHDAARDRVSDQGRSWLRAVALKVADDGKLDHELMASELAETCVENDIPIPSCRPDASDADRNCAVGRVMAKIFAEDNTVQADDFTITRTRNYCAAQEKTIAHYRCSRP